MVDVTNFGSNYEKIARVIFVDVDDGTRLRILTTKPSNAEVDLPLVLVPGMGSIPWGWDVVLMGLKEFMPIYYLETREKKSSKPPKNARFTIERMARDLKQVIEQLGLNDEKYFLMGSSMGGSVIVEALRTHLVTPLGTILVGPTLKFPYPYWLKYLIYPVPAFFVTLIKPLVRLYIHMLLVDTKKEPLQAIKYDKVLDEFEPWKMKKLGIHIAGFDGWKGLENIKTHCLLVGASLDKMHKSEATKKIATIIPYADFVDLGSNKNTHDMPMVETVKKYALERINLIT